MNVERTALKVLYSSSPFSSVTEKKKTKNACDAAFAECYMECLTERIKTGAQMQLYSAVAVAPDYVSLRMNIYTRVRACVMCVCLFLAREIPHWCGGFYANIYVIHVCELPRCIGMRCHGNNNNCNNKTAYKLDVSMDV